MAHTDPEQTRLFYSRESLQGRLFRVGSPPADEKFESGSALVITSTFTAAEGALPATFIASTRTTMHGMNLFTGFLRLLVDQTANQYRVILGDVDTTLTALDMSVEPRIMVVGVDPPGLKIKAWVNGILVLDSAYNGASWTNGIANFTYLRTEDSAVDLTLPRAEVIVGGLPEIF